jgi:biotin transporter BioY
MYIVAIGWIYVILMMAATERNFVSGVLTFLLYGVLPLAIMALLFGRRRRTAHSSDEAADRNVDQHDRADAERDQ